MICNRALTANSVLCLLCKWVPIGHSIATACLFLQKTIISWFFSGTTIIYQKLIYKPYDVCASVCSYVLEPNCEKENPLREWGDFVLHFTLIYSSSVLSYCISLVWDRVNNNCDPPSPSFLNCWSLRQCSAFILCIIPSNSPSSISLWPHGQLSFHPLISFLSLIVLCTRVIV